MHKLFEINFTETDELIKLADQQAKLLSDNLATAIYKTTLFGITLIANDCPVDTGRLRASIAGEYANEAGVEIPRGKTTEGKKASVTKMDLGNYSSTIGTNVEYALYVEYGYINKGPKKLTPKQIAYLIATGILKPDGKGGLITTSIHDRINRRAGISGSRVKGKGFFRRNIPRIKKYLDSQIQEAIDATTEGRRLATAFSEGIG